MESAFVANSRRGRWNKATFVGQKARLRFKEIWAIRVRLQLAKRSRDLAMFNLAVDSMLRGCDLVKLRINDVCHGDRVSPRAIVRHQKTHRPFQFEITEGSLEPSLADA
jgi:hypothetical protein